MSSFDLTSMILGNQVQAFNEVWKMVAGYPGDPYRVSISGRVQTRKRQVGRVWVTVDKWRDLSQSLGTDGRLKVSLCDGKGGVRTCWVHQLVLQEFVGSRPPGEEGCHFPDRDPRNNHLCNLRWDTHSGNLGDRIYHGTDQKGERSSSTDISWGVVNTIRQERREGLSQGVIAKRHGLTQANISLIVRNKTWFDPNYQPLNFNVKAKLTQEKADQIREEFATGCYSQGSLAKKHGVCQQVISEVINNKAWVREDYSKGV